MEEDHMPFLDRQDKVKASAAANAVDGGRCYKQQLDNIHKGYGLYRVQVRYTALMPRLPSVPPMLSHGT
eukprot:7391527-Prymnesium_polylepis.1